MTLWIEEGDLGSNKMNEGFKTAILDETETLWNKILELPKGAKHLQSNSNFMIKTKERPNTVPPTSPWKI